MTQKTEASPVGRSANANPQRAGLAAARHPPRRARANRLFTSRRWNFSQAKRDGMVIHRQLMKGGQWRQRLEVAKRGDGGTQTGTPAGCVRYAGSLISGTRAG